MGLVVDEKDGQVRPLSKTEQICRLVMVIVASRYRLPVAALTAKTARKGKVIEARHAAMYLGHTMFGLSQQAIAEAFKRDRTTVSYACHAVEDKRDEPAFDDLICYLELVLFEFKNVLEAA